MKGFSGTNRSKLLSPFSMMTWILVVLMMLSSLTSVIAETSEENKVTTMVFIIDSSTYVVNGEPIVMDVSPAIIENRTMLPIRYAAEPLGADIEWDGVERKATISLGEVKLELWIGKSNALINGKTVPIDADNANVKPLIVSNRTMLPLRFVTENLGCDIEWDPVARKATITKAGLGKIPGMSMIDLSKISDMSMIDLSKISDMSMIDLSKISDMSMIDLNKIPDIKPPDVEPPDVDIGKLTPKPDLKSDDISGLRDTWGKDPKEKEIPVNPTEADIPVIMRVGCGYDVFGEYASVDSLKEQVLDTQKLIHDQRMVRIRYDDVKQPSVEGRSIREYSRNMSVKASAGVGFMGFGGSASTNFHRERTEKTDNYFATNSYLVRKYEVYIKAPTDFKNYLTADAKKMLNDSNVSAKTIFDTFGHYVLVDSITGGRADYSVTASSKASTSFENFSIAAKAEFNVVVLKASASGEYKNVTNKAAYDSNRREEFAAYGGISLHKGQLSDSNALSKWASSLEHTGTLVDFGNKTTAPLVPIWDLCNDSNRKAYLKAEFDKFNLANADKNKWPVQKYIKDIMLMYSKDKDKARAMTRPGWQLIDVDLNKGASGNFVYLAYLEDENPEGAITDFFMESRDKGRSEGEQMMNHNANYVKYYQNGIDLNSGAGGRFLYLWFTREKTLPPITGLDIALDDPESVQPDWDSVCWQNTHTPANANEGTKKKGTPIYIKFRR